MRVPVLLMSIPDESFWLTDERPLSRSGQPVLVDASGYVYHPAEISGPILVKAGRCNQLFYDAAYEAGYQVVWMSEEID